MVLGTEMEIERAITLAYGSRMARIAKCESGFKQSAVNKLDAHGGSYGVFQINGANLPEAKRQGLDVINKVEDNLTFAGHILNTQGEGAWACSRMI